jgi:tetratricopeptide (TPR) repeat protein
MLTNNLANVLEREQRYDEAIAMHEKALAIRERLAPRSLEVARSLANLGIALDNAGRDDEARAELERAVALFLAIDPQHPDAVMPRVRLGQLEVLRGHITRAAELATDAIAIAERTGMDPTRLAEAKYLWAQAQWQQGTDRGKATDAAREALAMVRETGLRSDLKDAIEHWLASHPS